MGKKTSQFERGKAIVLLRPGEATVKEIPFCPVEDESIVIQTKWSGISTGTEMACYSGEAAGEGVWYPCVPGYEEVGEVVYVGPKAQVSNDGRAFKVGDRVMANEIRKFPEQMGAWGGQCGYAIKTRVGAMDLPAHIPDNVSYEEAVVAYLACVAKKGLDMTGVNKGETVLVTGCGNVGLSAIQLARIMGAGKVLAGDIRPCRLKLAKPYADALIDLSRPDAKEQILAAGGGKLPDLVDECSGNPDAVNACADYVRPGGRVHLQGQYRQPIIITRYARWNCSDLRISCSIALKPGGKEEVLKLVSEGKLDVKNLYTKVYAVDDAPAAYKDLAANRYDILKILFKWEN